MSEDTNTNTESGAATTEPVVKTLLAGQYADPSNLRQNKINDLIEDIEAAKVKAASAAARVGTLSDKLAELRNEEENGSKYDAITVGDIVEYVFGRGDKKRTLSGKVKAIGDDNGTIKLLVESGEGLDITVNKIDRSTVVFNAEPVPTADVVEADPLNDALTGTV